ATEAVPRDVLKSPELKQLYAAIGTMPSEDRGVYGKKINALKTELEAAIIAKEDEAMSTAIEPIDVTAPWDSNADHPKLLPTEQGTVHPLMREMERLSNIFTRMGFAIEASREIDDQYHMFEALNF